MGTGPIGKEGGGSVLRSRKAICRCILFTVVWGSNVSCRRLIHVTVSFAAKLARANSSRHPPQISSKSFFNYLGNKKDLRVLRGLALPLAPSRELAPRLGCTLWDLISTTHLSINLHRCDDVMIIQSRGC